MGLWQRMKVSLGLEDEWDEYDEDDFYRDESDEDDYASGRAQSYRSPYDDERTSVRRLHRDASADPSRSASLRSVPTGAASVTSVSPQVRISIVEPKSFGEAQTIADKFKQGTPVVMNLTYAKPDLAKRLLDFAAGLTYGLDGGLQKVSDKVFMMTPANVDVSAEDRRRLRDTGLFAPER